ncbi:hypothetical protein MTP06_36990 [Streptomyces sp. PLM4]|nr:hypothetical protein MTP06_36990 [Streptomyces sp. PLM4]
MQTYGYGWVSAARSVPRRRRRWLPGSDHAAVGPFLTWTFRGSEGLKDVRDGWCVSVDRGAPMRPSDKAVAVPANVSGPCVAHRSLESPGETKSLGDSVSSLN